MPQQVSTFHSFLICKTRHRLFFYSCLLSCDIPKTYFVFLLFLLIFLILSKSNKSLEVQPYRHFIWVHSPLPRPYPRPKQVLGFEGRQALGSTFCPQHSRLYHNIDNMEERKIDRKKEKVKNVIH